MVTTMTEKQCHYVKSPALGAKLQSPVLHINIQMTVDEGTKTLLVLNNGFLYAIKRKKHLYTIINEIISDSTTIHHIRDTIEDHKL